MSDRLSSSTEPDDEDVRTTQDTPERLRLDRWLWQARFCKTRSQATRLCQSGAIRTGGCKITKAHHRIKPGDILTFPLSRHIRVIRIVALGNRRGPATEARDLYQDLAPPEQDPPLPRVF